MSLIRKDERTVVGALAALVDCNPFLPRRVELEHQALGSAFVPAAAVWHADGAETDIALINPNTVPLRPLVIDVGTELRRRLAAGTPATDDELGQYYRIVLYLLFQRYENDWFALIEPGPGNAPVRACYEQFVRDVDEFLSGVPAPPDGEPVDPVHLFALGFQARRAFHHIFRQIFGGSPPVAALRASVWQAIFTRDVRRYRKSLHTRVRRFTTLIIGETGTGKELAAQAIGRSCYVPFDAERHRFLVDPAECFRAVNVSALPQTLIESELFGHRRGAFTGADDDHVGWLESCTEHGAVFLDEIGELNHDVQTKLLRVLQQRTFVRVGETTARPFAGKVIAATNRQLHHEIAAGRFREDLYFRLCGNVIFMPTLREQLAGAPQDLRPLLRIAATNVVGAADAAWAAEEVEAWVHAHLGDAYTWPGNMRELEQCVSNVVMGTYQPLPPAALVAPVLAESLRDSGLSADEMLECYCAAVYAQTGSYRETARRLRLDGRTVSLKVAAWNRRRRGPAAATPSHGARRRR